MAERLTRAERNIRWIESNLKIPDGPKYGQPLKLSGWQRNLLFRIYDNKVRTRMAILSFARKNAKTVMGAVLMLLHFIGPESIQNAKLYSGARTREQAGISFSYARNIILQNPEFMSIIDIARSQKLMRCDSRGTEFQALAAEASGAMGLNPYFVLHDELGQVRGPDDDFYEALESAMGAQDSPLSIVISTQASSDDDLLSILIDDAKDGVDPSRIVVLHSADTLKAAKKEYFSMEGLEVSNPGLYEFMNVDELVSNMRQAERLPAKRASFMNLNLNMRIETNDPFMSEEEWQACVDKLPPLEDCWYRYGGLDLSRTKDLTAFVVVGFLNGIYYVYPTIWIPEEGLKDRSKAERVPYFQWVEQKHLFTLPGRVMKRQDAADYIYQVCEETPLEKIAYDAWDYDSFVNNLKAAGFPGWQVDPVEGTPEEMLFEYFRQGYKSMSPAIRTTEELVLERRLKHGSNHPLNFCMANCKVMEDPAGNRKLIKASDKKKIDGAIAMVMALALAYREHGDLDQQEHDQDLEAINQMFRG